MLAGSRRNERLVGLWSNGVLEEAVVRPHNPITLQTNMPTHITSPQNPRIKAIIKLSKRRQRDLARLTIVEGTREVARALAQRILPAEAYICVELIHEDEGRMARRALEALDAARQTRLYTVTPEVFAKLAYRNDSGGLLLVIPYLDTALASLPQRATPFWVVIEDVEKPGNLGAILRTADAAGVDGVIVCHTPDRGATDVHNPNVVRASLGALFSVPVAETTRATAIEWLTARGINIVTTSPDAATPYTQIDMRRPVAVIMGSEARGLSQPWFAAADTQVTIPMHGVIDSLNLSTSTALLLYEVVRQRATR